MPITAAVPTDSELPPHDPKSEACALGCVLASVNSSADGIFDQLKPEHFYDARHKTLYRALESIRREGKHLDTPELDIYLRANKLDESAGGTLYYATLTELIPSAWNFPTYFEDLEDLRVRRALLSDAASLANLARDKSVPHKTLADASLRLLSAHSEHSKHRLPGVRTALDLLQDGKCSVPDQLITGILHQGSKAVLGSGSKARKTWLLLDVGISVSAGVDWWGFKTVAGPVLYINFELAEPFLKSRIAAIAHAKGVTLNENLHVRTLRGFSAPLFKLIPEFIQTLSQTPYRLIIIDPIYKGLGGRDENSAGDTSDLCNELEHLAVSTGAAVMFAAHFSKGNQASKEAIDRISGSGVFGRDPDTIITLTKHEEEGSYTADLILRNFAEQSPFVVSWKYPLMERNEDLSPDDLKGKKGRPSELSADDLLAIIPDAGLSRSDFLHHAVDQLAVSKATFYRVKGECVSRGKIRWSDATQLWTKVQ